MFKEEFNQKKHILEEKIRIFLPKEEGFQKTIFEAMNYSMEAGGKRIRPMLMNECYSLFGGKDESVIAPFLAAIEMIHTYSLVHDDLPAMDDDEYRRGRKTTHIVYGEAMGILAGDALLNYAFETASKAFDCVGKERQVAKALQILAKKAGVYGMVGGQVVDVELTNKPSTKEQLDFIYKLKTGALIEGSMMIGSVLAGASEEQVREIEQIAQSIGLAFQIQDDILDVTSTTEKLGKPVHSDDKNNKTTYVTLFGIEKAAGLVEQYTQEGLNKLNQLPKQNPFLEELLKYLVNRTN